MGKQMPPRGFAAKKPHPKISFTPPLLFWGPQLWTPSTFFDVVKRVIWETDRCVCVCVCVERGEGKEGISFFCCPTSTQRIETCMRIVRHMCDVFNIICRPRGGRVVRHMASAAIGHMSNSCALCVGRVYRTTPPLPLPPPPFLTSFFQFSLPG